jgi:hypothetical protein
MKKQISSKQTGLLASCLFILITLFYVACSKDNVLTSRTAAAEKDAVALEDKQTLTKVENSVYDHMLYRYTSVKPEQYLSDLQRPSFKKNTEKITALLKGKSYKEGLEIALREKMISPNMKLELSKLIGTIDYAGSQYASYEGIKKEVETYELTIDANITITPKEQFALKNVCAATKGFLKYAEKSPLANPSSNGLNARCSFWSSLGCWIGIPVLFAVVGGVLAGGIEIDDSGITLPGGPIGLVGYFILGLYYAANNCGCDDDPICNRPLGISIIQTDCSGNASLLPYGAGKDALQFTWTNQNGTPQNAVTAPTSSGGTQLRVNQPNSTAFIANVVVNCQSGNQLFSQEFNIRQIAGDPGDVFITPNDYDQQNLRVGEHIYLVGGPSIINVKNQLN